jgi:arylsulfatase
MVEHDGHVGEVLKAVDELGLASNTIVMYSSDNGAEKFTWPDGGQSPFRGEKNTNWEGGYRVPSMKIGSKNFKVHLDGYNIADALAGKAPSPRKEFFYFNDDGSLVALRYNQWKIVFAEQREHGFEVWREPFVELRLPKLFNLRADPFETADHEGMDYERWAVEHLFLLVPAQQYVGKFLGTFKDYPPRQKPGSFSIDAALETLQRTTGTGQ